MSTSTFKPVVGFDDNLSSRCQEYAPTQYAVGKIRAARTPYDRDNVSVLNDANCILLPGLYLMELNNSSLNTAGMKAGILYLYQIVADPDESVHGGHVVFTVADATMNIRQIGYFHNGTVEKVMTRVGTPLSNYGTVTVKHLNDIALNTTGTTFVSELGMWVKHYVSTTGAFKIEPAVTWSEWKEFGSGGQSGPTYTFLTTITNGVGLQSPDSNTWQAVGHMASGNTAGVVMTLDMVSQVRDDSYRYKVPTVNAVYNAFMTVTSSINLVSTAVSNNVSATNSAIDSISSVSSTLYNHINNGHPTAVDHADYNNNISSIGTVYTTPNITSINPISAAAKYTVPTVNAVYDASSNLNNYITTVSSVLSNHIATGGEGGGGYDVVNWPLSANETTLDMQLQMTSTYAGIKFAHIVDVEEETDLLAVVGIPAAIGSYGVVQTKDTLESYSHTQTEDGPVTGYIDEYTVPTINLLYNTTSNISTYINSVSNAMTLVSTTLTNHINNHPGGGDAYVYDGPFNVTIENTDSIVIAGTTVDTTNDVAGRMYYAGNASFVMPVTSLTYEGNAVDVYAYVYVAAIADNGAITYASGFASGLTDVPAGAKGSQGAYRLIAQIADDTVYQVQYGDITFPARY